MTNFKYIRKPATSEIVEKKSRFIANIFPVTSQDEAIAGINIIKKKNYDARHNCYAYIVGTNDEFIYCSDDGEPAHTAGRPMLEIIKKAGLHNVCVVVTRYFGGILLGTGGLVRAYGDAVKAALDNCEIYELTKYTSLHIKTDYSGNGKITSYAANQGFAINNIVYTDIVEFDLCVAPEKVPESISMITNLTGGKADITDNGEMLC